MPDSTKPSPEPMLTYLTSNRSCGIHLRAISFKTFKIPAIEFCFWNMFFTFEMNSHPCSTLVFHYIENNICTQVTNCSSADERVNLVYISWVAWNNNQVCTETVRYKSTYIILFLTWHNQSIHDDKNDDLCTLSPCRTCSVFGLLMTSQSIADDVTVTRQLWHSHVNSDN